MCVCLGLNKEDDVCTDLPTFSHNAMVSYVLLLLFLLTLKKKESFIVK